MRMGYGEILLNIVTWNVALIGEGTLDHVLLNTAHAFAWAVLLIQYLGIGRVSEAQ